MPTKPIFATITAFVALFFAVLALLEVYFPRRRADPGMEARLAQLERTVALQRESINRLESPKAAPVSREEFNNLRASLQSGLNAISFEVDRMRNQNPGSCPVPPHPGGRSTTIHSMAYAVAPGDTLALIAQKFHTSEALLRQINPYLNPAAMAPGQKIFVPNLDYLKDSSPDDDDKSYHVVAGDTLELIARKRGASEEVMRLLNPGLDFTNLVPGQRLNAPPR